MAASSDVTIRRVRDDDRLDEINAGCVAWISEAFIRGAFAATPDDPREMWIAEIDGQPAGYAHAVGVGVADGHRGLAYLFVQPPFRRRGVGSLLWQQILSLCTPDRVAGVMLALDGDDQTSKEIALGHGLTLAQRHLFSELDLATLDEPDPATRDDAIVIRTLGADLDEDGWRAFGAAFGRLLLDTPDHSSGSEPMPYGVMRATLAEPWQVMAAWAGDTMIGFTSLFVADKAAGRLETMLTGVERPYRGRGLATAMKKAHAHAVREAGWRVIGTLNVETNVPILASNRTLGFRPVAALQDVVFDHPPT
jgi:mycothiol synthase